MLSKITLYLYTAKYLKFRQIIWLCRRRFWKKPQRHIANAILKLRKPRQPQYNIKFPCAHVVRGSTHCLLGRSFGCKQDIWCDFKSFSDDYIVKFSAHYLDFLNSKNLGMLEKFNLLNDYYEIADSVYLWHPYTCSRRIINISNYVCSSALEDSHLLILKSILETEYEFLLDNIEYDIDANHLLTNYCALACSESLLCLTKKYGKKYFTEFKKQFLGGLHYERSFSYHSLMINEFILACHILDEMDEVKSFFKNKNIHKLYAFLLGLESYPQFGDSFSESFLDDLDNVKKYLVPQDEVNDAWFEIGGYCFYSSSDLKIVIDGGMPSPKYQPGHAHSSTFAINIFYQGKELVTNIGTNSYTPNQIRVKQRSQASYSSPQPSGGLNLQEVWSSFRVARRRKVITSFSQNKLSITCNGITRTVEVRQKTITIEDQGVEKTQLIVRNDHNMREKFHDFDVVQKCMAYKSLSTDYAYECTKLIKLRQDQTLVMQIELE